MIAALLLVLSAVQALAAPAPDAESVLRRATVVPAAPYEGRMNEVRWQGEKARSAEVNVAAKAGELKRERKGKQTVSDGRDGWGVPEERKPLVLKNYKAAVSGEEAVAGRKTWVLELKPVEAGKPRRTLWVDQGTGLILRSKRFDADGAPASLSEFASVSFNGKAEKALPPAPSHKWEGETVAGFAFESSATWTMNGNEVSQKRYTDGLASVSLFKSPAPVRIKQLRGAAEGEGKLARGAVVEWQSKKVHYVLIGDVSLDLLRKLAAELKSVQSK